MERNNISEAEEKKIRSYLMGWSETSNSAETYTKRYTQQRGNEVILDMGNQLLNDSHLNNEDKI